MDKIMNAPYCCDKCAGEYMTCTMSPVCQFCYDKLKERLAFAEIQISEIINSYDRQIRDAEITRSMG